MTKPCPEAGDRRSCLRSYFWQAPHSMIPLTSWMALWCTNTGYSVSQGCRMSCFLCLWAVGRQVRGEKEHHELEGPSKSCLEGSQLQHLQALDHLQVAPWSESSLIM